MNDHKQYDHERRFDVLDVHHFSLVLAWIVTTALHVNLSIVDVAIFSARI